MKTLMRTLTLSAAALAALATAPTSNAEGFRRGEARETRGFRGGESRGREFRAHELRGRTFFSRPAFSFGRRPFAPFRVFAGSRFYSYCPGPGYIFVDDLGWVFPPFVGAVWVPAHLDRFGVRINGFWR